MVSIVDSIIEWSKTLCVCVCVCGVCMCVCVCIYVVCRSCSKMCVVYGIQINGANACLFLMPILTLFLSVLAENSSAHTHTQLS